MLTGDSVNRTGQATNFAGSSFPYSPQWQLNGSVAYDAPLSEKLGLAVNLDANYQAKMAGSLGQEIGFDVRAYTLVNAGVALHSADDKWRIGLYAKNLFNTYHWSSVDVLTDTVFRTPGMARTYGLRLSFKY